MIRKSAHTSRDGPAPRPFDGGASPTASTGQIPLASPLEASERRAGSIAPHPKAAGSHEGAARVLVVGGRPDDIARIRRCVRSLATLVERVSDTRSMDGAARHLRAEKVDLVLAYLETDSGRGADVVPTLRDVAPTVPIIVVVEPGDERLAIKALQRDAQDYLLKDRLDAGTLGQAIGYAMEPHGWHQQYRQLLTNSPDGLLVVDEEGFVPFINASAVSMLGDAPALVDELPPPMRLRHDEPMDVILATGRVAEIRDADTRWSDRPARVVTMRDVTERLVMERTLDVVADELRDTNGHLAKLVETDPLTHVLNRRGFEGALAEELRRMRRTGDSLVAVLIDCDDFKGINDSYGHAVGDAALTALTRSVQGALRAGDHIGRVGGDEFLVLLPATSIAEGVSVAEKLRQAIKGTVVPHAAGEVRLSASLAVSSVAHDTVSLEEVLASVNHALKRSKGLGKDRVSSALEGTAPSDGSSPEGGLVPRIELDAESVALSVVFQDIRRLDDDTIVGSEALVRGPAGFFAEPSDLFRAALQQNVRTVLDLRALRVSLEGFDACGLDGWHHVNLFPSTLLSTPADRVIGLLARDPATDRLCLELSEQQFLGDPGRLRPRVREIHDAGYRIAIDDVGFGRSSVEALLLLEPDVVKIDQRCIRSIAADAGERRRLERLLSMLRAVEADVIVEGVETDEERTLLREMGVTYAQGFLWGEPRRPPAVHDSQGSVRADRPISTEP